MYGSLPEIKTQSEFDELFERCVLYSMDTYGNNQRQAEINEESNIRFYAGHCSEEVSTKVHGFLMHITMVTDIDMRLQELKNECEKHLTGDENNFIDRVYSGLKNVISETEATTHRATSR
jgi:hypothetical protein